MRNATSKVVLSYKGANSTAPQSNEMSATPQDMGTPKKRVWPESVRAYLQQQISQAANAQEREDAVRLAQALARA